MITVGITGGIGSGKTTVCKTWESLGAYILIADSLAKDIMVRDREVREMIISTFGDESYNDDGSLNRPFLAEEAFGKKRVKELNEIVHSRIPDQCRVIMNRERGKGRKVFVYEAALLLQDHRPCYLDYIVLVLSGNENRIQRVMERDDVDKEKVKERIENQQAFEKLIHLADYVIYNDGSLAELEEKAAEIYREFIDDKNS